MDSLSPPPKPHYLAPMQADPYAAHRGFVAPARDGTGPGRLLAGTIAVILAFLAIPDILVLFIGDGLLAAFYAGDTAGGMLLQLASFAIPLAALAIVMRQLHRRSLWSLVGEPSRALGGFLSVARAVLLLSLALELLAPTIAASQIAEVRPIAGWLLLLPVALAALLIQSGTEELFFRGYVQQRLAARWSSPMVWLFAPSALFGAVHVFNATGAAEGLLWAVWAMLLGLVCGDLTARHGTIGPAVGLHFVNNIFAFLLWGMQDGPNSGLALILYPYADPALTDHGLAALATGWGIVGILSLILSNLTVWLAARIALRR